MRSYGQFCPVAKASELFCERWTPLLFREFAAGSTRFSELQRGVPLMSPTLLSQRLKQLEAEGVIERRRPENGRGWTYHLTPAGEEFVPIVAALGVWGQRWTRRHLAAHEIDLNLLLWAIEREAAPGAFEGERTVIRLDLNDQPVNKRVWWYLNQDGKCELCIDDPGHEVDLYLSVSLRDLTYLYRGDLNVTRARTEDRLEVIGPAAKARRLEAWFNFSDLSRVDSMRGEPMAV